MLQKLVAEQQEMICQLWDKALLQNNPQLAKDSDVQYKAIHENLHKTFDQVQKMKISFERQFLVLFKQRKTCTVSPLLLPMFYYFDQVQWAICRNSKIL
jgi:hypothetical protein